MTDDFRRCFGLLDAVRRGLSAMEFERVHNLPTAPELPELVALMAAELAEVLDALVPGRNCGPGEFSDCEDGP